ncbi:MAG: hypothetical protein ACK55Z_07735, partial [bacterium]
DRWSLTQPSYRTCVVINKVLVACCPCCLHTPQAGSRRRRSYRAAGPRSRHCALLGVERVQGGRREGAVPAGQVGSRLTP